MPARRSLALTHIVGPLVLQRAGVPTPAASEVVWVSPRTMRLEVTRSAQGALITRNYLRGQQVGQLANGLFRASRRRPGACSRVWLP